MIGGADSMQEALQKPAADRQIGIWRRAAAVNACTVRWESIDHWVVARFRSCVKTLPPRGRCPSAHTGADEEWRYLSFSNAVRKNGCNRKIIAILTGCSQRCNLSPFLIRLAFGDPPSPRGKVLSAARTNPNLSCYRLCPSAPGIQETFRPLPFRQHNFPGRGRMAVFWKKGVVYQ